MNKNIALIYGDCSSPEIVTQAVRVLDNDRCQARPHL